MNRHIKPIPFFSGLLACAAMIPVQAAAKSDVSISIDQKTVSLTQLQKNNYEVPIFVRLEQNVNLNAVEFGIEVDSRCRFEGITRSDYAELYGESLNMAMSCARVPGADSYAWMSWGQVSVYYYETSNILLLLVKVPETAAADDVYPVHYLTQSPLNASKTHVWYNFGTNTDYAKTGSVVWSDGWIQVTPAEDVPEPEYTVGDVNQDGRIDILDAITVNRAILGKESLTDIQVKAADTNGNLKPDAEDSLNIMKYIVGLITQFPVTA